MIYGGTRGPLSIDEFMYIHGIVHKFSNNQNPIIQVLYNLLNIEDAGQEELNIAIAIDIIGNGYYESLLK